MSQVLGLRPFVPARDFALSRRFYQELGFVASYADDQIALLDLDGSGFILQNFYLKEFADNCMIQLLVRDVDQWWRRVNAGELVAAFGVREPRAPALQSWGMRVGFLFDPSGVLWHVAESASG
jgi:uncharacterized glyoxalase superfamily protein PhnB